DSCREDPATNLAAGTPPSKDRQAQIPSRWAQVNMGRGTHPGSMQTSRSRGMSHTVGPLGKTPWVNPTHGC
ncbi:hypothetical protein P7K49_024398, partial [Saguinus oedipus]